MAASERREVGLARPARRNLASPVSQTLTIGLTKITLTIGHNTLWAGAVFKPCPLWRSAYWLLRFLFCTFTQPGVRSSVVVKALCYKPEGRGFETR
jgi:hypothetical protein